MCAPAAVSVAVFGCPPSDTSELRGDRQTYLRVGLGRKKKKKRKRGRKEGKDKDPWTLFLRTQHQVFLLRLKERYKILFQQAGWYRIFARENCEKMAKINLRGAFLFFALFPSLSVFFSGE